MQLELMLDLLQIRRKERILLISQTSQFRARISPKTVDAGRVRSVHTSIPVLHQVISGASIVELRGTLSVSATSPRQR
eukprot:3136438-Amphidinium_carterae.1